MFSGNRKVRSSRVKTVRALNQQLSSRGQTRHLTKKSDEVSSQIHRLECFITDAPRLQRQQRLANVNMLPPMELPSPRRTDRRRPIAQRRAKRGQRLMLLTEGAVIVGMIAAVVGWLNQWFHFWGA